MARSGAVARPRGSCYRCGVRRLAALLALACCRPPAPPPAPPRESPIFFVTPDRLYTTAPVGDGVEFVEVVDKELARRPGEVTIELGFPQIDLPDEERERELAAAIAEAGHLEQWIAETGKDRAGTVKVQCTAPLATTALVSVVCVRHEVVGPAGERNLQRPAPTIAARTWQVDGGPVRPLGWSGLVKPGVTPRMVLGAALAGADEAGRAAWLAGECGPEEPEFTLDPGGLMIWPTSAARPCDALRLERERLQAFLVPNGTVARSLRVTAPEPDAAAANPGS